MSIFSIFQKEIKIGLITRCKDEYFVAEFVKYYLSQGIDKIYVIDDDSNDKSIYDEINDLDKVKIIYENNIIEKNYANQLYQKVKNDFNWMIYVDVDEFITTKKNKHKTIRWELKNTFRKADCVKIPWVMMSCNGIKKSPRSILKTNVYRWNHDLKHENKLSYHKKFRCRYEKIEVKSIFKTTSFNELETHVPKDLNNKKLKYVDGVYNQKSKSGSSYAKLREKDVNEGHLLCYHYRIISLENNLKKLKNNKWYIDDGYTIDDLMSTDYPEIVDRTLMEKSTYM